MAQHMSSRQNERKSKFLCYFGALCNSVVGYSKEHCGKGLWLLSCLVWFCFNNLGNYSKLTFLKIFFLYLTASLRHNLHAIQPTHLKYIIQWFLVYSQSCETITTINFEHFPHPEKKPYPLSPHLSPPPLCHGLLLIYFLSLWIRLIWMLHMSRVMHYVISLKVLGPLERHKYRSRRCLVCGEKGTFIMLSFFLHLMKLPNARKCRVPSEHPSPLDSTAGPPRLIAHSHPPSDHLLAVGSPGSAFQPCHVEKEKYSVFQD